MRFLCALAVFVVCAAVGLYKSALLHKRARLLSELLQMLSDFSLAIRFTAPTLDELSDGCTGDFGALLSQARKDAPDIKSAWEAASAQLCELPYTDKREAELISRLGQELGTCDAEGQLSMLELYRGRLKKLSDEAEENAKGRAKLFRSVGALLGLGAAILMI